MNLFKKFQKSHDDPSLKHSKSMPFGLSSQGSMHEPCVDPRKAVHRGKTPLKTSDIVYVEQAPGMLDIYRAQLDHPPTRAQFDTGMDLLEQFPSPPQPPPRPPRSALRTTSLHSNGIRPQLPTQNCNTSDQRVAGRHRTIQRSPSVACFSRPTATAYPSLARKQRREATTDQAVANVLKTTDALVARTPLLPPVPTTHSPRPYNSRANLRRVPSHVAIPSTAAPDHGQSYWPHRNYRDYMDEQNPDVICSMITGYPVAPCYDEHSSKHLQPIRFNMENPDHLQKTLSHFIHTAVAQGRPLDARAHGRYHRIIDAGNPTGIVPEVGADWSRQVVYR
ncbi:hypothetical protein DEU56DRAFT_980435 [Suillus clintonianus]|uniref:uncharacterized protein n=1 Tax=Suillus clintonianus TaxID=1904413 RepID=UPI001B865AED|nr:uncharacterized protein DEU56DRAFT_980435 [Suillus clintonianus]KAG2139044.1 hypothetical protein DEU56DRAFT_980435 [Suillus clintonianus]